MTEVDLALKMGFFHAVPLRGTTLHCYAQVREACAADRCRSYGQNWVCPPACGSLEECAHRISAYSGGILVQTVGALEDEFDYPGMEAAAAEHRTRFDNLHLCLRRRYPSLLPLGMGGCGRCGHCTYPAAPCRHPDLACSSMEAYGLLVSEVCVQNGLGYYYGPGKIAYTSCFLF